MEGDDLDGLTYPFGADPPAAGEPVEVAPGIRWWSVPVPGPLRQVNGYLLEDDDRTVAVDTGFNTDDAVAAWRGLLADALADRPIGRVVCTHFHPDHSGLAGWLARKTGAPLVMTRVEWLMLRLLVADARPQVPAEMIAHWRAAGWSAAEIDRAAARGWDRFGKLVSRLPFGCTIVGEGDVIAIGGHPWRAIVGRGHSPAHLCLLDEGRGLFLAGDQLLPRISPNVSVTALEPEGDPLGDWLASIERLRMLPADLLVLPGHGAPFRGLHARLASIEDEHRTRLDALAAHLAQPRRARDCFPVLFRRSVDEDMLGLATGEALAHLHRLRAAGRAVRETADGVWWWRAA